MMTYNVRRAKASDGQNQWRYRRDAVADVILGAKPDLAAIQEATIPQVRDLDARLPGYLRVGGEREHWPGEEPNVLYYDPDRWRVLDAGIFWLSRTPLAVGSRSWGDYTRRNALWALMLSVETTGLLLVVNTHLDHGSVLARRRSAQLLQMLCPHALLLGDFNAIPGRATHGILLAGRKDPHLQEGGTFHGWNDKVNLRLDWILVPEELQVGEARVLRPRRPDGRHVSDHDPVVADVRPPTEPAYGGVPDLTWTGDMAVPTKLPPSDLDIAHLAALARRVAASHAIVS